MDMNINLPEEVKYAITELEKAGFEAAAVGGCVRDIIINQRNENVHPADWDVATNALPEEIQKIFTESYYTNAFGTVVVNMEKIFPNVPANLKQIEITTYRKEEKYEDNRHPAEVEFITNIDEDLSRRDFTVNAMALKWQNGHAELIDLFGGIKDLESKTIKAVGDPDERFKEDALRLVRAVRFACQLDFKIEPSTGKSIKNNSHLLENISEERKRDELMKIINRDNAEQGIRMLHEYELLRYIIPELEEGINIDQNKHHIYTVWEHNVKSLGFAVLYKYDENVRLAALLHDIGKVKTKRGEGHESTFYNHEIVGSKMARNILQRLKFSKEQINKVGLLIRYHLFYYNVGEVTESSVRRLVNKVGAENIDDLIKLRICDRKGSGTPKAKPYKLRHLEFMVEKVLRSPISLKTMAVNGNDVMKALNISSGPKIGLILNILFEEVLDDSSKNNKEYLEKKILELSKLSEQELLKLGREGKEEITKKEEKEIEEIKKKHFV